MLQVILIIIVAVVFMAILFLNLAPQIGKIPRGKHLEKIKKSPNYLDKHFENDPPVDLTLGFQESLSLLGDWIKSKGVRPRKKIPSIKPDLHQKTNQNFLTWFGHSTVFYQTAGKNILFDPILGSNAAPLPFGVRRFKYDLPAAAEELPPLDMVIISHDHYDHLHYPTIRKIKDKTKLFLVPLGVGAHLRHWGVPKHKIHEFDWWQSKKIESLEITAVPSQHFSGRSLTDRQKTLWAAWVVHSPKAKIFFGGDSGYSPVFRKIGQKFGPFDFTMLDFAQYDKAWPHVHMKPEQSLQAHKDLQGKVYMPIHWSAFTLALHRWTEPIERALKVAAKQKSTIVTPKIGERFNILTQKPQDRWWQV